jgi:hypothetical protein
MLEVRDTSETLEIRRASLREWWSAGSGELGGGGRLSRLLSRFLPPLVVDLEELVLDLDSEAREPEEREDWDSVVRRLVDLECFLDFFTTTWSGKSCSSSKYSGSSSRYTGCASSTCPSSPKKPDPSSSLPLSVADPHTDDDEAEATGAAAGGNDVVVAGDGDQ